MTKQKTAQNFRLALRVAAFAVGALCAAATSARATTIVFNNPLQAGSQSGWLLGMDFTVNDGHTVTVTELGAFDDNGDGFGTDNIEVGIFDLASGLLVGPSATFTGSDGNLVGGSRFLSVAPFVLEPGTYSIVAVGFTFSQSGNSGFGDVTSFNNLGGSLTLDPKGGRWEAGTTFKLPTANVGNYSQSDPVFLAGTFGVPDGGMTALMLGIGMMGLGLIRRIAR
jgi:hypothetical protein